MSDVGWALGGATTPAVSWLPTDLPSDAKAPSELSCPVAPRPRTQGGPQCEEQSAGLDPLRIALMEHWADPVKPVAPIPAEIDSSLRSTNTTAFARGRRDRHAVAPNDIKQGYHYGDCFLLAGLAAIAQQRPEIIEEMITTTEISGVIHYVVHFKRREGTGYRDQPITVNPNQLSTKRGRLSGDKSKNGKKEIWPLLVEAAFAQLVGGEDKLIAQGEGQRSVPVDLQHEADTMSLYTGIEGKERPILEYSVAELRDDLKQGKAVTLFSRMAANGAHKHPHNIYAVHEYSVKSVDQSGRIHLFNPHGQEHPEPLSEAIVKWLFRCAFVNPLSAPKPPSQ